MKKYQEVANKKYQDMKRMKNGRRITLADVEMDDFGNLQLKMNKKGDDSSCSSIKDMNRELQITHPRQSLKHQKE